jgi:hypothetical protein
MVIDNSGPESMTRLTLLGIRADARPFALLSEGGRLMYRFSAVLANAPLETPPVLSERSMPGPGALNPKAEDPDTGEVGVRASSEGGNEKSKARDSRRDFSGQSGAAP